MIKVTMEQILKVNPVLGKLVGNSYTGRIAFAMARLAREVSKEMALFEDSRMEIIRKYADKDENNETKVNSDGTVHISDENLILCNGELNEILNENIELTIEPLPIDWFENIELTIEEALALEPFVN